MTEKRAYIPLELLIYLLLEERLTCKTHPAENTTYSFIQVPVSHLEHKIIMPQKLLDFFSPVVTRTPALAGVKC